jgi:GNAT superfamily N-acetyltransferase
MVSDSLKLRPATLDDIPFMASLHAAAWREVYSSFISAPLLALRDETYRTDYWRKALIEGRRGPDFSATIAELNGRPQGFCYALPGEEGEAGGEIESLFLVAEARGRGIGRSLVANACHWLEARRLAPVVIWAFESNPYRRFYETLGGAPTGRRPEIYPTGDALLLVGYFWRDAASLRTAAESGQT